MRVDLSEVSHRTCISAEFIHNEPTEPWLCTYFPFEFRVPGAPNNAVFVVWRFADGASYTYDAAGNRTSKTDLLSNVTSNYGYDAIYQLLSVTQGASTTESYTYDLVGNRLSSLGMSPYVNNSSNELTSTPAASYTYDKNGNLLTKTPVGSDPTNYTWDYENRLAKVVLPANGGTVTFKYDPFGRRVQKSFSAGGTTNYLYDGANLVCGNAGTDGTFPNI